MVYFMWTFLVVLLTTPYTAQAATFYVSNSGTNNGTCGQINTPCQTFEYVRANRGMAGGDTVFFRGGSYPNIDVNNTSNNIPSGTAANPTIIAGVQGEVVTMSRIGISWTRCNETGLPSDCGLTQYVTYRNFKLSEAGFSGCHQLPSNGTVDFSCGAHFIRLEDSEISGFPFSCLGGGFGASNVSVINTHIHHCGTSPGDHGVYACWPNALFDNVEANNNSGYGIQHYESGTTSPRCGTGTIVRNSYMHHNQIYGGAVIADGDNIQFYNNVVEANTAGGVAFTFGGGFPSNDNYQIYNNTIVNNGGPGMELGAHFDGMTATNPKVRNNLFVGNNGFPIVEVRVSNPTYSNNMCPAATDPGCQLSGNAAFVGSGAHPWALTAQSEARNAGTPIATFTTDKVGAERGQGGQWDIGAYEYVEGGGPVFNFAVETPTAVTVTRGNNVTFPVTISLVTGNTEAVTLNTNTLPSGVTATGFAGSPCSPSCTVNVTLNANAGATLGTFTTPVLVGTSASSVVRQTNFTVTVNPAPASFDFAIANPGAQTVARSTAITVPLNVTLSSGTAGLVTLTVTSGVPSGVTANIAGSPCTPPCTSTLTLTASGLATVGTTTLGVHGVGGSQVHDMTFNLTVTGAMSSANPIYVRAGAGSPTNSCIAAESQATAKQTINDACQCMTVPGKVMFVEGNGNTYSEAIDTGGACLITGGNGPAYDTATRIEGYGTPLPTIQSPVGTDIALWVRGSGDHYTIFKKLRFDAMNHTGNGIAVWNGVHHIRFDDVQVKNTVGGFETFYILDASNIELIDVFANDAGTDTLTLDGSISGFLCQRCHFFNAGAGGAGVRITSNGTKVNLTFDAPEVRNNSGTGLDLGASTGTAIQNMLSHSNGGKGLWIRTGASGTRVYNSTVYGNTGVGLQCDAGATSTQVRNTIMYGNTGGNLVNTCGAATSSNLEVNPLFVAPPTNLHLADGSPGIDAGEAIPSILTDYEGNPRQQGQQDIGAYERTTTPPVSPDVTVRQLDLKQAAWYF